MSKPDQHKTREELVAEISALRERLDGGGKKEQKAQRSERVPLRTSIELIADFDLLKVSGMNLSQTGIGFETDEPLMFEMRFTHGDQVHEHRAKLVWMQRGDDGVSRLGLEFAGPLDDPEI